ncbi:UDP-N-acetylmuramate dehydrogenase [Idiomarina seosinensis]|uniref:UDP-N-acetylmuramate dehydrogenase n=1 Tax=Idiomarina seosinensis TaxID=281739 RepID=UPI00384B318C
MSVDLQPLHSFRLPARASELLQVSSDRDLRLLNKLTNYLILASGSNTVFVEDYQGTIVQPRFFGIDVNEDDYAYHVSCGASENWHDFVLFCMQRKIFGLENLALIPGSVGASPVQNIGAYGVEVADYIDSVECFDLVSGELLSFSKRDCNFNYRDSLFKRQPGRWLICRVNFKLTKNWQPNINYPVFSDMTRQSAATELLNRVIAVRQAKLPNPEQLPNAGSFFKNPLVSETTLTNLLQRWPDLVYFNAPRGAKIAAGWLIDNLGLKGFSVGDAAVHQQQALVLVNKGNATGEDVLNLCQHIRRVVFDASGITLEPEVRLIGRTGLIKEWY